MNFAWQATATLAAAEPDARCIPDLLRPALRQLNLAPSNDPNIHVVNCAALASLPSWSEFSEMQVRHDNLKYECKVCRRGEATALW